MIEEIRFHDSGKKINITIDNEKQSIPIQTIDKLKTFINLRQELDTPLQENINIDADLYYVPYDAEVEDIEYIDDEEVFADIEGNTSYIELYNNQPQNIVDIDGIVTLTIYNEDNSIYIQKDINFQHGHIQDSIANKLRIGEYRATLYYKGNKYFQETLLNIIFNITKRDVNVTFSQEEYYGDITETITIQAKLKDAITNKPVKNCTVKYNFDDDTYSTTSNATGDIFLKVTIPDADEFHCVPYVPSYDEEQNDPGEPYQDEPELYDFDEDGNIIEIDTPENIPFVPDDIPPSSDTQHYLNQRDNDVDEKYEYNYPNASYLIELYSDSESYYIHAETNVVANKLPTELTINQQTEIQNNIVTLGGNVVATYYNNLVANAKYGHVIISFDDTDYVSDPSPINNDGNFSTQIDFAQITEFNNDTDNTILIPYQGANEQITSITIKKENEGNISIGDAIIVSAKVQSKADKEAYVKDGMIVFILYNGNNEEVYRYATEIDNVGQGVFLFNTSKKDKYTIKAHYYGIFGYKDSDSNILENIEVK